MSSENKKRSIVCRCEDVSLEEVERAIDEGYTNLEEIKRLLRCGMGACQGRTCLILMAQILSHKTGRPIGQMKFPTVRPPIRPVPVAVFSASKPRKRLERVSQDNTKLTNKS